MHAVLLKRCFRVFVANLTVTDGPTAPFPSCWSWMAVKNNRLPDRCDVCEALPYAAVRGTRALPRCPELWDGKKGRYGETSAFYLCIIFGI